MENLICLYMSRLKVFAKKYGFFDAQNLMASQHICFTFWCYFKD